MTRWLSSGYGLSDLHRLQRRVRSHRRLYVAQQVASDARQPNPRFCPGKTVVTPHVASLQTLRSQRNIKC